MQQTVKRCPRNNFDVDRTVGKDLWTLFAAIVPEGDTFEEVCMPRYFGAFRSSRPDSPRNSDNGLRVRDRISVAAKDGSWVATLFVRAIPAGVDEVHTSVIEFLDMRASEDLPEGYKIEHRSVRGHVIFLNGVEVEAGFSSPEEAENRIKYLHRENGVKARVAQGERAGKAKVVKEPAE